MEIPFLFFYFLNVAISPTNINPAVSQIRILSGGVVNASFSVNVRERISLGRGGNSLVPNRYCRNDSIESGL